MPATIPMDEARVRAAALPACTQHTTCPTVRSDPIRSHPTLPPSRALHLPPKCGTHLPTSHIQACKASAAGVPCPKCAARWLLLNVAPIMPPAAPLSGRPLHLVSSLLSACVFLRFHPPCLLLLVRCPRRYSPICSPLCSPGLACTVHTACTAHTVQVFLTTGGSFCSVCQQSTMVAIHALPPCTLRAWATCAGGRRVGVQAVGSG